MADQFANAAQTTLNGGINNSVTSITVTANSMFPGSTPFRIRVVAEGANADELMTVTAGAGTNSWTVTRASETYAGSASASAHGSGALVQQVITAGALATFGGTVIQYPALKPGTPTDDFATSSLGGGYTAHSSGGTFITGNCMTQGVDWVGSSVELQFSSQFGGLYTTHADADFDFTWGGVTAHTQFGGGNVLMYGIAALNSSGTGVGVTAYNDQGGYFATITTWNYASFSDNWAGGGGGSLASSPPIWFRLKRVSGTWTGYMSKSGRVWDKTFSTRADSIVVDRLYFGLLFDSANTWSGRLTADYYQLDV